MVAEGQIPTRANCNPNDPEEAFLWAFTGMPDVVGALLLLPNDMMRKLSAHLVRVGAMMQCPCCGHEKEPEILWRMSPTDVPMVGAAGEWVDASEPETDRDVVAEKLAEMKPHVKKIVAERLAREFPDVFGPHAPGAEAT